MTDKELLATIARQFDYLDTDDASSFETVICKLLIEHGYLTVEDNIDPLMPDDILYSEYRFNPMCPRG
jgi:hypothetical protein